MTLPRPRRSARDDQGVTIAWTALMLVTLITFVAFAIDLGRLSSERRDMQANADVVALDLVRLADGRTEAAILASTDYATTLARSAAANGIAVSKLDVNYGFYDHLTGTYTDTPPSAVPNAVQVKSSNDVDWFFAQVFADGNGQTSRTAIGALDAYATLTLGSKTATMNTQDSAVMNHLLNNTLCRVNAPQPPANPILPVIPPTCNGNPNYFDVSAGQYQGLAIANFTLRDLQSGTGAATPGEVLTTKTTARGFGLLVAEALRNDGRDSQADLIEQFSQQADTTHEFEIRTLLNGQLGGPPSALDANLNALNLFLAGAQLANQKNAATGCSAMPTAGIADLGFTLTTGFSSCSQVVETPVTAYGRVGDAATQPGQFRTAQFRVTTAQTTVLSAGPVTGTVLLPVTFSLGGATGELTEIICDRVTGQSTTDTIINPQPVAARLGAGTPIATLTVTLPVVGSVSVDVRVDKTVTPTTANPTLIDDQLVGTTRRAPGVGLALGIAPFQSSELSVTVTPGRVPADPVTTTAVTNAVLPVLNQLLAELETSGSPVLDALGVGISTSDLTLDDVDCDAPLLRG